MAVHDETTKHSIERRALVTGIESSERLASFGFQGIDFGWAQSLEHKLEGFALGHPRCLLLGSLLLLMSALLSVLALSNEGLRLRSAGSLPRGGRLRRGLLFGLGRARLAPARRQ